MYGESRARICFIRIHGLSYFSRLLFFYISLRLSSETLVCICQSLKRKETGADAKPAKAPKAKAAKSEDGLGGGGGGGGFRQPQHLSEALAELTGHKVLARTQVSTFLSTYIKENGLKNPANGREILWYVRVSAFDTLAFLSSVMLVRIRGPKLYLF